MTPTSGVSAKRAEREAMDKPLLVLAQLVKELAEYVYFDVASDEEGYEVSRTTIRALWDRAGDLVAALEKERT